MVILNWFQAEINETLEALEAAVQLEPTACSKALTTE